ncbi:hypothetical protein BJY52DRAFT_1380826 [Lactarius psammicola]|nr:hypothetical protein BJY52DRAFT_1380826 [Lactarius psammicola]
MFPEAATQYSVQALNELQVVFSHARADAPTSDTSTFPYTAKQREEIAGVLERNKDRTYSSYVITYVARLWTTVARFKNLWVDQLISTSCWREHISDTVEELKQMVSSMLALLIANVLMTPMSSLPAFSSPSLLLCLLCLVKALFLMQEQRKLLSTNAAAAAAVHLDNPNTSYRFRQIATIHSLPQALFTWALPLFAMQSFWMTFAEFPLSMPLATFLPVATVALGGILYGISPTPKNIRGYHTTSSYTL